MRAKLPAEAERAREQYSCSLLKATPRLTIDGGDRGGHLRRAVARPQEGRGAAGNSGAVLPAGLELETGARKRLRLVGQQQMDPVLRVDPLGADPGRHDRDAE